MSRGRKRKPGRRHPCGKRFRADIEQDAMATALAARRRQYGVSGKQARDERLGSALGRLAYRGMISTAQYEAGLAFAELHQRHHAVMGLPSAHPRSVAALLVNEGIFGGATSEATLDVIDRMQRRYREATDALDQCDRDHRMAAGHRPSVLAYRVVCIDEDIRRESEEDLGNLRVALNALVRVFRVPGEKLRN